MNIASSAETASETVIITLTENIPPPGTDGYSLRVGSYYRESEPTKRIKNIQGEVIVQLDFETLDYAGSEDSTPPELIEFYAPFGHLKGRGTVKSPSLIFGSTEAGAITYGGACSSSTDTVSLLEGREDENGKSYFKQHIALNELAYGVYDDCTITVTDASGNASQPLRITKFERWDHRRFPEDITAPVIRLVTPVRTPIVYGDGKPIQFSFHTTEEGIATYGGRCVDLRWDGYVHKGTNTAEIGLGSNLKIDTTYDDCTVSVADGYKNESNVLRIPMFKTVRDTTPPVLTLARNVQEGTTDSMSPFIILESTKNIRIAFGEECRYYSLKRGIRKGRTTIAFNILEAGTHTCTITPTDYNDNIGDPLEFSFTIERSSRTSSPVVTEVTNLGEVRNPVEYTFRSSKRGIYSVSGSCVDCATNSRTTDGACRLKFINGRGVGEAEAGDNTITFDWLEPRTRPYDDCIVSVRDYYGKTQLPISEFTVLPSALPQNGKCGTTLYTCTTGRSVVEVSSTGGEAGTSYYNWQCLATGDGQYSRSCRINEHCVTDRSSSLCNDVETVIDKTGYKESAVQYSTVHSKVVTLHLGDYVYYGEFDGSARQSNEKGYVNDFTVTTVGGGTQYTVTDVEGIPHSSPISTKGKVFITLRGTVPEGENLIITYTRDPFNPIFRYNLEADAATPIAGTESTLISTSTHNTDDGTSPTFSGTVASGDTVEVTAVKGDFSLTKAVKADESGNYSVTLSLTEAKDQDDKFINSDQVSGSWSVTKNKLTGLSLKIYPYHKPPPESLTINIHHTYNENERLSGMFLSAWHPETPTELITDTWYVIISGRLCERGVVARTDENRYPPGERLNFDVVADAGKSVCFYSRWYTGGGKYAESYRLSGKIGTLKERVDEKKWVTSPFARSSATIVVPLRKSEARLVVPRSGETPAQQTQTEGEGETPPARSITGTYSLGDTHDEIRYAQIVLNRKNCPVAASGAGSPGQETRYFGAKTRSAIICYQRAQGLPETGQLTPALYSHMVATAY